MSEELVEQRNLDVIVAEIRALTGSMLNAVIEIGRRMVEAKEMLPYGEFGEWVKVNTGYSHTTAANFMKLFNEYGNKQMDMFGNQVDSYIGRLNYSKALELLALPEPEREEFAEAVSADGLTVKELKEEIKKWKEKAEKADAYSEKAEEYGEEAERRAEEAEQRAEEATQRAQKAEQELKDLQRKPAEIIVQEPDEKEIEKRAAEQIAKAEKEHQAKLAELDAKVKKAEKAEAEAKAKAAEVKEAQAKELAEAKARAEEAEKRAALAKETASVEVEQLKKQLAMADPVIAEFKGLFGQASELSAKLVALVAKAPAEQADKMRKALAAVAKQLTEV